MKESDEKKKDNKDKKEEKSQGTASSVIKGLGDMIPGLGGLIKGLEKLPAFKERLEDIDKEVERKLREEPLKRTGTPHVRTSFTTRTFTKRTAPFGKKVEEPILKPKEPPVDIFDEKGHLMVIAELPGVEENDIKLELKDNKLIISAHRANRRYYKEIELPYTPKSTEFEKVYRNGVLEIRIKKE